MNLKWGPNHAADPIVTKWARNEDGGIVVNEGKFTYSRLLHFIVLLRLQVLLII